MQKVIIIGAGLAGSEAAWQLGKRGIEVDLYEMRPDKSSPVHETAEFSELVCSNSLGSINPPHASFLLKEEMREMDSLIIKSAYEAKVPAGKALAVDRAKFSKLVTEKIESLKSINIKREEVKLIPKEGIVIVASGPLTSHALSESLGRLIGEKFLYFYDSVSPIIDGSTVDMQKAFFGSRWEEGKEDYLNIPLTKDEYYSFVDNLRNAELIPVNKADQGMFFEGCLPIEVMAKRGIETLSYGPLKPVGLGGRKPCEDFYAVIQLRREDKLGTMYNMVGFQTRMTVGEQGRVLKKLPGLGKAKFLRYGKMHRNTYVNSRKVLNSDLSLKKNENIYISGQLSGVEGYVESAATGLAVSLYIALKLKSGRIETIPVKTMIGSLINHVVTIENDIEKLDPMNANFGVLSPHFGPLKIKKKERKGYIFKNSLANLKMWYEEYCKKL